MAAGARSERWRLDLDSHILFSPLRRDELSTSRFTMSSLAHEKAHWIRWQGSSIGLLVTLLRRARAITATRAIGLLPDEGRSALHEAAKQRPIWAFETGYEPEFIDPRFALSGQMWLDMNYLENRLLDGPLTAPDDWPDLASLGPALSDAWRAAESFPGMPAHPGNDVADHLFGGSGGLPSPADTLFETQVTARRIWECACTLDELALSAAHGAEDHDEHRQLMVAKLNAQHNGHVLGIASRATSGTLNADLFRLVAWLATDPPLPFLTPSGSHARWVDLSPAHRFLRLYQAVRDHARFAKLPRQHSLADFAADLLATAGMQQAHWAPATTDHTITVAVPMEPPIRELSIEAPQFGTHPGSDQPVVGSLNMLIRASMSLRAAVAPAPELLAFPTPELILVGEDFGPAEVGSGVTLASLLDPLAQDFADGLYQARHLEPGGDYVVSHDELTSYVASVYLRAGLDSLIAGTPLRRAGLPRHVRAIADRPDASLDNLLSVWAGRGLTW